MKCIWIEQSVKQVISVSDEAFKLFFSKSKGYIINVKVKKIMDVPIADGPFKHGYKVLSML